jgi:hypothetical protein
MSVANNDTERFGFATDFADVKSRGLSTFPVLHRIYDASALRRGPVGSHGRRFSARVGRDVMLVEKEAHSRQREQLLDHASHKVHDRPDRRLDLAIQDEEPAVVPVRTRSPDRHKLHHRAFRSPVHAIFDHPVIRPVRHPVSGSGNFVAARFVEFVWHWVPRPGESDSQRFLWPAP